MGLLEEIEDTKAKLAELAAVEEPEVVEEVVEKPAETPISEPETVEEPVEAVEKVEKTPSEYRAERLAKKERDAAIVRENEELRAQLAALTKPAAVVEDRDPEPDRQNNYEAWLEWKIRKADERLEEVSSTIQKQTQQTQTQQLMNGAAQELKQHIDAFKVKATDFDDVADFAEKELARSLRITQGLSGKALQDAINTKVLGIAAIAARAGEDPAEALYNWAKDDLGYKPQPKEETKVEVKPDLAAVAKNKARNAGLAGAAGGAKGAVTPQAAGEMNALEWSKLSAEDKASVMRQLAS